MTTDQRPDLRTACDEVLERAVSSGGVPGVVAMVTDRERDLYGGVAGRRSLDSEQPMTADSVFAIFSTTKAITGTACLQLVEEGRLDLDAPAADHAPELAEVQVLEGFDDDGSPRLRPPASPPTTRQLLTHTAGFAYDFFNADYLRLATEHGQPSVVTASRASLRTPLLFDPGTRWHYGSNIDWAGQVVEGITGQRLGDVFADRIFAPLGMDDTAFSLAGPLSERRVTMHQRDDAGTLAATDFALPEPEVHMGGHGLWSTVPDYMKFIRMWLNDGEGPGGRVLRPETAEMAAVNHLEGDMTITGLPGVIPSLSNDAEFFPGMPKTWALTFMINDEPAPTGRPAGALAWAGLANLYYWIDRANGIGGFWATQIFPFADPASVGGYLAFETAAYSALT
ncbi:serine hydrolase domain-containing protein [Nocardioides lentus]|uniref:Serine hydrolase domain-containing protein n=1 Tax=Nocardioides lentus TaxID=338077 RepID=A0ABN2PM86_9ACTN